MNHRELMIKQAKQLEQGDILISRMNLLILEEAREHANKLARYLTFVLRGK